MSQPDSARTACKDSEAPENHGQWKDSEVSLGSLGEEWDQGGDLGGREANAEKTPNPKHMSEIQVTIRFRGNFLFLSEILNLCRESQE